MKKKSSITVLSVIILIITLMFVNHIRKQIVFKGQVKEAINILIKDYDFIDDFELSGYLSSNVKLNINEKFNNIKHKEKEWIFEKIYDGLGEAVIKNVVKYDIKMDSMQLVHSKLVSTNYSDKFYRYNYSGLSIKHDTISQPVASKNYTFEEVEDIVEKELSNHKDIKEIDVFVRGNKKTTKVIMQDAFFDNTVKSQYTMLRQIFNEYASILRDSGVNPDGHVINVVKLGNEYISYSITDAKFELISFGTEISKYEIEEDENILDKFDNVKASDGTYGKETVSYSEIEYSKEPTGDNKAFAWTAAKATIKDNLKSPSTAKFPFSYLNEDIKEVGINTFVVKSYVDAENSLGAKLSVNFMIKIKKTGDNTYEVLDVQIYE